MARVAQVNGKDSVGGGSNLTRSSNLCKVSMFAFQDESLYVMHAALGLV